jgi:hypothetical protein
VTILIPNAKISSRWNGALQSRLRQAPLEQFLRSRGLKWMTTGETRITDNLASATIYFVGEAINACAEQSPLVLAPLVHPVVGQSACVVSSALALLIHEPNYWRTGSLVATARLLEKFIGLSAAAHLAAAAARDYSLDVSNGTVDARTLLIGRAARTAVESNAEADSAHTIRLIMQRLLAAPAKPIPVHAPAAREAGTRRGETLRG